MTIGSRSDRNDLRLRVNTEQEIFSNNLSELNINPINQRNANRLEYKKWN